MDHPLGSKETIKALILLDGLRKNVIPSNGSDQSTGVDEAIVRLWNEQIQKTGAIAEDLHPFTITQSDGYREDWKIYDWTIVMTKMDGAIRYISSLFSPEEKRQLGFEA
jgi:hypothetical protein